MQGRRTADSEDRREGGLIDRCAVAFLSALTALATGTVAWLALGLLLGQLSFDLLPSFGWVLGFTAVMALLGFLLLENLIASVLGRIWRVLVQLLSGWL